MKNNIITLIFVSIFFLILSIGFFVIPIFLYNIGHLTEKNTIEFIATVTDIEIIGENDYERCVIHTKEYGDKLSIYSIRNHVNRNDITNLKENQIIVFRIENIWVNEMHNVSFLNIVSIKTEEKEIFTINEYNDFMRNPLILSLTVSVFVDALFIYIFVKCIISIKKIIFPYNKN